MELDIEHDETKRLLIVSPHTDDGEISCGGTIARFVEAGWDVHYIALSACEKSVRLSLPKDTLRIECRDATQSLGIPKENVKIYEFEVRDFPDQRQDILETFVKIWEEKKPNIVIGPSSHDVHQDHITTRNEILRAFRQCTILGFELPWDYISFETQCFVPVTKDHLEKKMKAMKCYKSQSHRGGYMNDDYILGLARTRGSQIKAEYAECFEVIRWVMRRV
ncbi:MAG: PIG-L deacetylase family protein [Candidatus Altiarchaeota archaeon]